MTIYRDNRPISNHLWAVDEGSSLILIMKTSDGEYSVWRYAKNSTDQYDKKRINDIEGFIQSGMLLPDDHPPQEVLQLCGSVNLV